MPKKKTATEGLAQKAKGAMPVSKAEFGSLVRRCAAVERELAALRASLKRMVPGFK